MLDVRDKGNLLLIKEYASRVKEKINGLSYEDFRKSHDVEDVVCFNLFQIGETANKLSEDFIKEHKQIPWG